MNVFRVEVGMALSFLHPTTGGDAEEDSCLPGSTGDWLHASFLGVSRAWEKKRGHPGCRIYSTLQLTTELMAQTPGVTGVRDEG